MEKLDNFDRSILLVLQADGKIGNQDLAEKVNLSSSPCWRRVRKLEDSGVIDSYVTNEYLQRQTFTQWNLRKPFTNSQHLEHFRRFLNVISDAFLHLL